MATRLTRNTVAELARGARLSIPAFAAMTTRRISLPLSNDGEAVNMVLAGHIFEHGRLARDVAFSLVRDLKELRRVVLE